MGTLHSRLTNRVWVEQRLDLIFRNAPGSPPQFDVAETVRVGPFLRRNPMNLKSLFSSGGSIKGRDLA